MSRNGSGTFTVVNTFVSGNTITATGHNQNWSDLATEMTNSVAADGQTTMTGALKAASGTVTAPGLAFASDANTGIYRIGSDNLGIAANGAKVVDVATTGVAVTGDVSASGVLKQAGFALIPVGFGPAPWSGTSAPTGWVLTGQTLSRTTYADLWDFAEAEIALSNALYGVGDGSTTFTIASMGGRVPAGKEASASRLTSSFFGGNSTVLGATGGLEQHDLTAAEIPSITSSGSNTIFVGPAGGNTVLMANSADIGQFSDPNVGTGLRAPGDTAFMSSTTTIFQGSNSISVTSDNTSGDTHNNVQPTIIVNYIIFAGV